MVSEEREPRSLPLEELFRDTNTPGKGAEGSKRFLLSCGHIRHIRREGQARLAELLSVPCGMCLVERSLFGRSMADEEEEESDE